MAGRFSRPIYPVPENAGLGVHATVDLGGQVRFGPDVEWVEKIDYAVDPTRATNFYNAVRKYFPGLNDGALLPGYSGIQTKKFRRLANRRKTSLFRALWTTGLAAL